MLVFILKINRENLEIARYIYLKKTLAKTALKSFNKIAQKTGVVGNYDI